VALLLLLGACTLVTSPASASSGTASPVEMGCQSEGATITTALAAFRAANPGITPTEALLVSHQDKGPYIDNWPQSAPYFTYSLSAAGTLRVSVPSSAAAKTYQGPSACKKLEGLTSSTIQVLGACEADGATISVAIAAFHAQNPSITPTEKNLVGSAHGGPYLKNWAHNSSHYAYTVSPAGSLLISIPATAKAKTYVGPNSCFSLLKL